MWCHHRGSSTGVSECLTISWRALLVLIWTEQLQRSGRSTRADSYTSIGGKHSPVCKLWPGLVKLVLFSGPLISSSSSDGTEASDPRAKSFRPANVFFALVIDFREQLKKVKQKRPTSFSSHRGKITALEQLGVEVKSSCQSKTIFCLLLVKRRLFAKTLTR